MKRTITYFAVALLALLLAACANPSSGRVSDERTSTGTCLRVTTGGAGRSVLPETMVPDIYVLYGSTDSGASIEQSSSDGTFTVENIDAGNWTLTVVGKDLADNVFLEGTTTATIAENQTTNVLIRLAVSAFNGIGGTFDFRVTWPADKTPDSIVGTLTRVGASPATPYLSLDTFFGEATEYWYYNYYFETGSYVMSFFLAKNGVKISRVITDTVVFYNGKTSRGSFDLTAADFGSGCVVAYNSNGGDTLGTPLDANYYDSGDSATVLAPGTAMAMYGYVFTGWNTASDGSGDTYQSGDTIAIGAADIVLYAIWTEKPKYTITYNKNDATIGSAPTDASDYYAGDTMTISWSYPGKTGYAFKGWNTHADGSGDWYLRGQSYEMPASDLLLYAIFSSGFSIPITIVTPDVQNFVINGPASVVRGKSYSYTPYDLSVSSPSYQWYLDGVPIPGKTTYSLSYAFAETGFHSLSCLVKASSGAVYSASKTIQVLE